ncbi:M1 family aminopeptidase [Virgibacillus dakarensis]|uniref:M1 family aminopeptidase n=1 Tax=Virgibacillus dakarensis TaxID=1917889 RepID=UPI00111F23BB|nr:M1 family aminopeptidase [Virgibacillus dakarensis]
MAVIFFIIPGSQSKIALNQITSMINKIKVSWSPTVARNDKDQTVIKNKDTIEVTAKDIPTYYITALLDDKSFQINGQVNLTINNPGTDTIVFYTYPYSWSSMNIKKVFLNDEIANFAYDRRQLTIKNPYKKKELSIQIEFQTPVPRRGTRFGYKDNVWLVTTWYPMLGVLDNNQNWVDRPDPIGMGDPYLFNFANYVVEWTSSPSIKWLSSGTLLSETMVGNERKMTWKVDGVRNFALAGSTKYKIKEIKPDENTTISIALTSEENFDRIRNITNAAFSTYKAHYGQLPYSNLAIIETGNDTNFALEYPNLAVFSKDMYVDNKIEHWLPHEIGHIWWYNAVGINEVKNGWIDEGLAEMGVVLYLENRYSKSEGKQLRDTYRKRNQLLINTSPYQTLDAGLYRYGNRQELYDSWYARSADMFLTLRDEIGEKAFNHFLKTLYQTNVGETINEDSIAKALKKSVSIETDLFQNWIHDPYQLTRWDIKIN